MIDLLTLAGVIALIAIQVWPTKFKKAVKGMFDKEEE